MEQIRIVKEMREHDRANGRTDEHIRPRWMVWENVPGAFSSNKGEDFQAVLTEIVRIAEPNAPDVPLPEKGKWPHAGELYDEMGRWSIAYKIVDAQYWGTPQRRRRISLVFDGGGVQASEVLFKQYSGAMPESEIQSIAESVSGYFEQSDKKGQETARAVGSGTTGAISFQERAGKPGGGKGILIQDERTGALSTLNNQSVFGICSYDSNSMKSPNPNSGIYEAETSRTLDLNGGSPDCNQGGMVVLEGNGSRDSHKGDGYAESETMYTLNTVEQHAVAYRKQGHPMNAEQGQGWEEAVVNDTLNIFDNSEARTPTVVIENHPNDSRVKIREDGMVQTLSGRMGTGGGNVPLVMEGHQNIMPDYTAICIGNGQLHDALSPSCEVSKTLNCMDDPMKIICGKSWDGGQISPTLTANNAGGGQRMPDKDNFNAVIQMGVDLYNQTQSEEVSKALNSAASDSDHVPCTYGLDRASYNQGANAKFDFSVEEEMIGPQISRGPSAVCARDYKGVGNEYVAEDKCIVEPYQQKVGSLCARDYKGVGNVVRRLTPLECERLQGYPDGWTDIGDWVDSKGKKHKGDSDSPRYKALGNSIALPSWYHLLKEISNTYEDGYTPTLGSLFDGIGGFPLCWELINGKGSARWASEIDSFCIAVTERRFCDE
jgi:site-specific DNA-cytosine methylase